MGRLFSKKPKELEILRLNYKLNKADPNVMHYEKNMNNYGVDISGLSIPLYGRENCKELIMVFLSDAQKLFNKNNIQCKIVGDDLPM